MDLNDKNSFIEDEFDLDDDTIDMEEPEEDFFAEEGEPEASPSKVKAFLQTAGAEAGRIASVTGKAIGRAAVKTGKAVRKTAKKAGRAIGAAASASSEKAGEIFADFKARQAESSENRKKARAEKQATEGEKAPRTVDSLKAAVKQRVHRDPAKEPAEPRESSRKSGGKKRREPVKRTPGQLVLVIILDVIVALFSLVVIAGCAALIITSVYLVNVTANDATTLDINSIKLSYSTRLMAKNPETGEWEEYERIYGTENRIWIDYGDMPDRLINALVASEDQRFWTHHGVDWKRTIAAFINYLPGIQIYGSNQVGSTIPQQLIKNITGENEAKGLDGVLRKIREIYRALVLDKNYSKEQILEAYLNTINLSGNAAGIESAAKYYFNKTTKDLTVAECAAIICITKSPTAYNPYLYPENNKVQRDTILYQMQQQGYLTDAEYDAAMRESDAMVFNTESDTDEQDDREGVWSWFTETARDEVLNDLQKICGMTYDEAYDTFYNRGLTIYLTIDQNIQAVMDSEVDKVEAGDTSIWPSYLTHTTDDGEEEAVEGAAVVMNYKGELLDIIGSMYPKTANMAFNRAYDAKRSTGSSIKPIAVYAPAIELNMITYSTLIEDAPITIFDENDRPMEWPRNYDNVYGNPVTINVGIRRSLNTTAVHVMQLIGYDYAFDFMTTRLGITTLQETYYDATTGRYVGDRTNSLALGGLTNGISVYEMCAAFQIFGNAGQFVQPHCYTIVQDGDGNILINKESNIMTIQAISEDTAYIMNHLMREVMTLGTGTNARYGNMPLAAKSGTTSDNYDYWFIGMNPYYVCATWEGFDHMDYIKTVRPHPTQLLWKSIMSQISEGLEDIEFPECDSVRALRFCMQSGDLATESCPQTAVGYYKANKIPGYCDGTMHSYSKAEDAQ